MRGEVQRVADHHIRPVFGDDRTRELETLRYRADPLVVVRFAVCGILSWPHPIDTEQSDGCIALGPKHVDSQMLHLSRSVVVHAHPTYPVTHSPKPLHRSYERSKMPE